jgi:putative membrane protein
MSEPNQGTSLTSEQIFAIERPDHALMTYYVFASLIAGPFFPFVLLPLYFRYHTMRYRFSDEGVSMRWGILFRREINLTFARIQDIHLISNFVERWLGLARIQIQTASGSAKAEMTIEGVREYGALRDFLYSRMRGARGMGQAFPAPRGAPVAVSEPSIEVAGVLREVVAELRAIRQRLDDRSMVGNRGAEHD